MGTKHDIGCYQHALDDEPIFTLSARDPALPEAIRFWITQREAMIGRGEKPLEDHAQLAEAAQTAQDAVIWRSDATDPSKYPDTPRWRLPKAPDAIAASRAIAAADGSMTGGMMLPYDEWIAIRKRAMPLGNRFLIANIGDELVFWENRNYLGPRQTEDWTGYYPLRHSLQKEMLWGAYDDWRNAMHHKASALKDFIEPAPNVWYAGEDTEGERPIECKPLSFTRMSELLDYATCYGEFDENTPNGTVSKHGESMSSPMNDMRRAGIWQLKRCMGIIKENDPAPQFDSLHLTDQYDMPEGEGAAHAILTKRIATLADDAKVTLSAGALRRALPKHMTFIVTDLATKVSVGLRQVTGDLQPFLERHFPDDSATMTFVDRINGYAAELEAGAVDSDQYRSRTVSKSLALGEPYGGPGEDQIMDRLTRKPTFHHDIYRHLMEDVPVFSHMDFQPGQYRKDPADTIAEIAEATDSKFDPATQTLKAESDTIDVTDVPELPPHRFTVFSKANGWAYGRGLEISPTHIPAMLDSMEGDGWSLVGMIGEPSTTKVGMIFKRVPRIVAVQS